MSKGGKTVSIYNPACNLPPWTGGSNFRSSASVYSCLFDFNLIFFIDQRLCRSFDSVYISPVWILYLHLNWAEICRWTLLSALFTPKDYFSFAALSLCNTFFFLITQSLMNLIYSVYQEMSNGFNY